MTTQITPSKTVGQSIATPPAPFSRRPNTDTKLTQAASAIEGFKMGDSPTKKINFAAAGKENLPLNVDAPVEDVEIKKPVVEEVKEEKLAVVAPTIKPEEADEPLLQENPQRFVLFP